MQESSTIENMLLRWIEAENAFDWLLGRVTGSSGGSAVSVEHEAELKRWAIFSFQPTNPPPYTISCTLTVSSFVHFSHYHR